jgi:LacI family transcriptional regulator
MAGKRKRPTLSEVATKAGVGTTTVSRVINGGHRVDPGTLARVRRVIDSMGYMPNQAARILKGDHTRTIGLLVPSIADPFFSSCAEAAQAIARANDFLLIVATTQNDPQIELESVNVLMRHHTDGLIIAPATSENPELRKALARAAMPVVSLDRPFSDSSVPSVVAENFAGARLATQHLIDHGYQRILCMTGEPALYTISERICGYCDAVRSAGLPVLVDTSVEGYTSAEHVLEKMLSAGEPPDAIFTLKNSTTMYTFEALQKLNIGIPSSVALLGYDDFELADAVRPSITVIQQPIADLGRIAAELLFEILLGHNKGDGAAAPPRPRQVQLGTRLICRGSCGCSPARQKSVFAVHSGEA